MLDRQTEIIAHFIGAFQQTTEQVSSRQHYDTFRAQLLADKEPAALLNVNVHVSSDYNLQDFTPGLRHSAPPLPPPETPWIVQGVPLGLAAIGMPEIDWAIAPEAPFLSFELYSPPGFVVTLAPPSSVVTVTFQSNHLIDGDRLINSPFELPEQFASEFAPEAIAAKMAQLVELAETMGAPDSAAQWVSVSTQAEQMQHTLETLDPDTAPAGGEAALFRDTPWAPPPMDEAAPEGAASEGAASEGAGSEGESDSADPVQAPSAFDGSVVLNGQFVEEAPDTLTLRLEARTQSTEEPEPLANQVEVEDGAAGTVHSGTLQSGPTLGGALESTQSLSAGDNLLLNQTQIAHDWLDAPVIATAGSAQSLSLISQISVLHDHDQFDGLSQDADAQPSQFVNLATQETLSNPAEFLPPSLAEGSTMLGMVCIKGDLVIDNTSFQINQINDSDVISHSFGPHQTEISTGGNTAINQDLLLELGARFDVILASGNLVQLAAIHQINVLLDDDLFLSAGDDGGLVSGHNNLGWNEASITRFGDDAAAEMSGHFQSALDSLAQLPAATSGESDGTPSGAELAAVQGLFADPLLAGLDSLRVLWVEGDLLIRDTLTQINLLSDSDVISVGLPGEDPGVDLASGDNILANVAGLTIGGVDSTIMAGAGSYSDAVLYQAGMLDDGAMDPMGAFSSPQGDLASEAVLFLTDDLNDGPGTGFADDAGLMPDSMHSGALDALHSVLA